MSEVKQVITGDSTSAQKAYADLARQVAKLESANQRMANELHGSVSRGASTQGRMNSVISQGIDKAFAFAAQWASVGEAIKLASQEIENFHRLNKEALDTNVSAAQSQSELIGNLAGVSSQDRKKFLEQAAAARKEAGFESIIKTNQALSTGLSASGGDREAALKAFRVVAPLAKNNPDSVIPLEQGVISLAKTAGNKDYEAAAGFMESLQGRAFPTKLSDVAANAGPAIRGMAEMDKGNRAEAMKSGGALFAYLSNRMEDQEGRISANAELNFGGDIRAAFEKGIQTAHGHKIRAKEDPGTLHGRLAYMQSHPEFAKAFVDKGLTVEQKAKMPLEQLLLDKGAFAEYSGHRENLKFDKDAYAQDVRDQHGLTPQLLISGAKKKSAGATEEHELGMDIDARRALARETTLKTLEKTTNNSNSSMPWIIRTAGPQWAYNALEGLTTWAGDAPETAGIAALKTRQKEIVQGDRSWATRLLPGSIAALADPFTRGRDKTREELSPAQRGDYDAAQQQIDILKELRDEVKQMNSIAKQKQPSAAGAARAEAGAGRER